MASVLIRTRFTPEVRMDLSTGRSVEGEAGSGGSGLGKLALAVLQPAVELDGPVSVRVAPNGDPGSSQWLWWLALGLGAVALAVVGLVRVVRRR